MMNFCHMPGRLAASARHLRSMAAACALALAPLAAPAQPAAASPASAASPAAMRQHAAGRRLGLTPDMATVRVKGRVSGRQSVDYTLHARAGQSLRVQLTASNRSAHFNVLPADSQEALFVGPTSGDRYEGRLPADGVYRLQVFLMRSAARRNEKAPFTLDVSLLDEAPAAASSPVPDGFEKTLDLQGIRFHVSATRQGATSALRIVPSGLSVDNSPITRTIDGTVTGAEVADLNVDGSPEVYVYVTLNGAGAHGTVVAYSANRRRSLSDIHLPELPAEAARGYQGHDEFAVVESVLARRFPVYPVGDADAKPTASLRQLQYRLVPGEASWQLKLDRVTEF
jgi:hypothetical protein